MDGFVERPALPSSVTPGWYFTPWSLLLFSYKLAHDQFCNCFTAFGKNVLSIMGYKFLHKSINSNKLFVVFKSSLSLPDLAL